MNNNKTMIVNIIQYSTLIIILFYFLALKGFAQVEEDSDQQKGREIAKQLQNPVVNLISIPFHNNYGFKAGPLGGFKYTLNFQPVVPFPLNSKWNLITRTIVPVISKTQVIKTPESTSTQTVISDKLFSAFLSPADSKTIWGIGPAISLPVATDALLGSKKWAAGPTGILLKQSGHFTTGILVNHLWSLAGDEARTNINATYYQPFISCVNKSQTTFALSSESTHDFENKRWTTSIVSAVSQLTKLVNVPTNLQLGNIYYFAHPGLLGNGVSSNTGNPGLNKTERKRKER